MTTALERYFDQHASSYDRRSDSVRVQRLLRPVVLKLHDQATSLVASLNCPRVLDVGCGPGRIGEAVLAEGATQYVGVDISGEMISLARQRLARFGSQVELHRADFMDASLAGPFDVVLALGLFDYIADPVSYLRRMRELTSGVLFVTFPRWNWLKDPTRKLVYEGRYGCSLQRYDDRRLGEVLVAAGFENPELSRLRTCFCVFYRHAGVGWPESQ